MNTKTIITTCLLLLGTMALQAQELIPFKEDILLIGKWGYKNDRGTIVIKPEYTDAQYFSEGLAMVATLHDGFNPDGWGFIDIKGKMIVSPKYNWAKSFSEGLAGVKLNGKWGYIDKTGKEIIPLKYFDAHSFSEGYAAFRYLEPKKWGFIDKTGKEVVLPKYDNVHSFSEGLAAVQINYKWGFVDQSGKEVIPLTFDRIGKGGLLFTEKDKGFQNGKILVKKDGREFYIDKTGKEIEDDNVVMQKMTTAYQSGNFTEAFKLAEQLANKHNADVMNLLGNMYAQGQGTKQNYGMAHSWWEMASNKGNAAATGNIGLLYAQGWGVPQNIAEAEKWFKKGADLGDPQSMFNLGNLAFQKGNFTEARQWIQKAKTAGHPQADTALQQISEAESKANRMRERN